MMENSRSDETKAVEPTLAAAAPVAGHPLPQGGRHFKVRNIGIHGARGTGKTCYLACCLYGQSVSENVAVILGESPSLGSLQNAWDMLTRGELPQANAVVVPDEIEFSLQADRLHWKVRTRDYAGSLVQLSDTGVSELRQEVREWLVNSDAIFILVNADLSANDPAARERMSEIEVLLDQLLVSSPDGNTVAKPLALLLTKWDVQGQISDNAGQEEQRSLAYLQSHPLLQQIAKKIEQAGDRVKVFPVSAFGSHRDGNLPPPDGPRPFNLHAPLVWAAQKADEMLFESAKRDADLWVGPERRWKRYSRAIACYDDLIKKAGINKGPVHDQIRAELRPLKKARFTRRCWQIPLAIFAVLVAALIALSCLDAYQYYQVDTALRRADQIIDNPTSTPHELQSIPDELDSALQPYLHTTNPLADWSGNRQEARDRQEAIVKRLRERIARDQDRDFKALKDFCEVNEKDEYAKQRLEKCKKYLADWKASPYHASVEQWRDQAQAIEDGKPKYRAFDEAFAKWGTDMTNTSPDAHEKRRDLCREFLKTYREADYPERKTKIGDVQLQLTLAEEAIKDERWRKLDTKVRGLLQPDQPKGLAKEQQYEDAIQAVNQYLAEPEPKQKEARELLERITWQKVTDYTEKYPQNYDVIGRLVREYIGRKDVDKTHLSEATKLKKQKEIEWDRTAFEEIRRTAKPAYEHEIAKRSPESLQKARERAESYLQSRNDRLREPDSPGYKRLESFWKELDRWVKWIETVEKQTEYRYWYEIKSVRIPDGAQANGSVWVKIEVNGNGEVGPAKWLTGRNVTVEQTYGPYTGIWGSPGELRVHVLGYRYWPHTNDDFPAVVVKDDNFIPGKGSGVVRVPARDGKEIEIELRCWQKINDKWHSVPPVLPEYPIARETTAK